MGTIAGSMRLCADVFLDSWFLRAKEMSSGFGVTALSGRGDFPYVRLHRPKTTGGDGG
jgi:hypothetical protein